MPNHRSDQPTQVFARVDERFDDAGVDQRSLSDTLRGWFTSWEGMLLTAVSLVAIVAAVIAVSTVFGGASDDPATAASPLPQLDQPMSPEPSPSEEATDASPSPSPTPAANPAADALGRLQNLSAALTQQVGAGQLRPKAGRELVRQTQEVAAALVGGEVRKASEKFADLRHRINELVDDEKLTAAGYAALPDLQGIADAIRTAGR